MEDESPLCKNASESGDSGLYEDLHQIQVIGSREEELTASRISSNSAGITWYKASFLIVNAALGTGLLNFPLAFEETGGIVSGNIAHFIFVSVALGSLILLALCATEKDCKTYQEVVKYCCGDRWAIVCSICISVYCFVTCVTFITVVGDQFDRAFASFFGAKFCLQWYLNRNFTMVVSSLLLIFPCCLKRIDGMMFMSYVGVATIAYLTVVIAVEMAVGQYTKGDILVYDLQILKFFKVVPAICFGYQCHVSSVPILSCLKKRDKNGITKACVFAVSLCFLVYTVTANCGYITFGNLVSSDILLDYDARKGYVLLAVLLLAIKSWTTYPILLFCVREAVSDLYLDWKEMDSTQAAITEPRRRKVIATVLWIGSILPAVFIPGLNTVIKLLGCLAGVFIMIFPGMCYLFTTFEHRERCGTFTESKFWARIVVAVGYMALGTFSFGLAFILGMEGFLHTESDQPICVSPMF